MFSADNITLTGKLTNPSGDKLTVRGELFEKEIPLKSDGTFNISFPIEYDGVYLMATKNNRAPIYLTKTSKLNISADDANFNNTIKFEGAGSAENNYWQQKNTILSKEMSNPQLFYSTEELVYLEKIKTLKNNILALINTTKLSDKSFKENEKKSLDYFEQLQILVYERYHSHYAKKEGFKTSESFPKVNPSIDYDNEADYQFSSHYKQLVNANFNNNLTSKISNEDEYTYKVALPEIKKIKSKSIKNALIQNLAYEVIAGNPDSEMLYNEIMALSDNTKLKESLTAKYNKIKTVAVGKVSPTFEYENFKGGKTSLESLKGKYVYIDVWATWCGPCRKEIPSLQSLEEKYHGKNIEFVSISIDTKKDYDKWKKFVEEKSLGGIQLFADNDWNSKFITDYAIEGIPRFILVDPQGNITSADAPRPSDPKLIEKFDELGIK